MNGDTQQLRDAEKEARLDSNVGSESNHYYYIRGQRHSPETVGISDSGTLKPSQGISGDDERSYHQQQGQCISGGATHPSYGIAYEGREEHNGNEHSEGGTKECARQLSEAQIRNRKQRH